jgi:hypothetical protein
MCLAARNKISPQKTCLLLVKTHNVCSITAAHVFIHFLFFIRHLHLPNVGAKDNIKLPRAIIWFCSCPRWLVAVRAENAMLLLTAQFFSEQLNPFRISFGCPVGFMLRDTARFFALGCGFYVVFAHITFTNTIGSWLSPCTGERTLLGIHLQL